MPAITVFVDCEFTSLEAPELLSVGLVAADGREFYAELNKPAVLARANGFVREQVLPQWGKLGMSCTSVLQLNMAVAQWLMRLHATTLYLCYDYHTDMDLLEAAIRGSGSTAGLIEQCKPTHVGYLLGDPDIERAMYQSWVDSEAQHGLLRHHALADARALRAGFVRMHNTADAH